MPSTGNIPCVEEVLAGDSIGKLEPGTVGTFVEDISENPLEAEKVRRPRLLKMKRYSRLASTSHYTGGAAMQPGAGSVP